MLRGQGSNGDDFRDISSDFLTPPSGAGGDAARVVFASAPHWFYTSSWHCRHPDSTNEHSYLDAVGPNTAEEVSRLYRNRQMKGSNLIVGLASDALPCKQVPAAFYRTLGYLFELAKSGLPYTPVTQADLLRGSPDPGWCTPLWQSQASTPPPERLVADADAGSKLPPSPDLLPGAAEALLLSAPFWCYLYNHEPSRSKKTPPKTAEEMLAVLRSNCLPEWAPLIGLGKDVATFNSLPPCLFMTMGSLSNLVASGATYRPVGLAELNRYDKFFNSRTTTGNTQGMQQLSLGPGTPLQAQPAPAQASHSSNGPRPASTAVAAPQQQQYADAASMYPHLPQQPSSAVYMQCGPPPSQFMSPSPLMWYGNYHVPPGQMYPYAMPLAPMPHPEAGLAAERSSAPEPMWRATLERATATITTQLSSPLPDEDFQDKAPKARAGRSSDVGRPAAGHGPREPAWQTPLFRLFLADSTNARPEARWWLLASGPAGSAAVHGPFCCEEMILQYASGRLRDNQYICGTTADVIASIIPPSMFEPIAKLLQMVDSKQGKYVLHSAEELVSCNPLLDERSQLYAAASKQRGRAAGPVRRAYKSHDGEAPKPRTARSHSHQL